MNDPKHTIEHNKNENLILTTETKKFLIETANQLKGSNRRAFMAKTVNLLGENCQRTAERELEWNRGTIRKGQKEIASGFRCVDNFIARGRKPVEEHLKNLLPDIEDIVNPTTQTDPTFRTTKLYTPLTAKEVHKRLIEDKNYKKEELPTIRTISNKLKDLGCHPQKVAKTEPKKKIAETDDIFDHLHKTNKKADGKEGVLRISIDAKAKIKIGPFSRGGYNRCGVKGADHDFAPKSVLFLFGFFLPAYGETFFFFTESKITADFIIDALEKLWPFIKEKYNPHTLVINSDNGPENSSRRTQFMKRIVEFTGQKGISIHLAYYPPYHSKYNPVERVWGVLEKHWNGEILNSVEKVLGLARSMTWKGKNPVVEMIKGTYKTGIKLAKKEMLKYESMIKRKLGLEKWFVTIEPEFLPG